MDLRIKGILTIKNQGLFLIALSPAMQLFKVGSRDMNQEILFIFIKMNICINFFQKKYLVINHYIFYIFMYLLKLCNTSIAKYLISFHIHR